MKTIFTILLMIFSMICFGQYEPNNKQWEHLKEQKFDKTVTIGDGTGNDSITGDEIIMNFQTTTNTNSTSWLGIDNESFGITGFKGSGIGLENVAGDLFFIGAINSTALGDAIVLNATTGTVDHTISLSTILARIKVNDDAGNDMGINISDPEGVVVQGKNTGSDYAFRALGGNVILGSGTLLFGVRNDNRVELGGTASSSGRLSIFEDTDNGANSIILTVPSSFTTDRTWTLPTAAPVAGQFIQTDGSGNWSYAPVTGSFTTDGDNNMYVGTGSLASLTTGIDNFVAGVGAATSLTEGLLNVFVGNGAGTGITEGSGNVGIGYQATFGATTTNSICIGTGATCSENNTIVLGAPDIATMYVGGITTTAPQPNISINAVGGSGTNINAADLISAGGRPTGSGTGGKYRVQTATAGASGTTLRSLVDRLEVDENGNLRAFTLHNNITAQGSALQQDIRSGTYTPTLTNVTNIAASTAYQCQWLRVGNTVTVSGKVDIDVTIGAASELGLSLPVTSDLGNEQNLGGTGSSSAAASLVTAIKGDAANNRAAFVFVAVSITNDSYFFEFSYLVL